jgi:hypothetical protein
MQPAPAAPAMPRPTPIAPAQQTTLRPAAAPGHPQQRPAVAPGHQAPRPMQSPQPHAPHAPHAPQVARPMQSPGSTPPPIPQSRPAQQPAPAQADEEAIALVEDADGDDDGDLLSAPPPGTPSKIKFGAEVGIKKHAWKRQPTKTGTGACRVRTFHGKLSDQGLEYIDEAINLWLDDHPEIDIKFVTTNVGMFDGKFKDLALVVNVWY